MFCERCGARFEEGGLVCFSCGTERRRAAEPQRPVATIEPQLVLEGPRCPEHPGMPLLGNCPRCDRQVCVRCAPDAVTDVLTCTRCQGLTTKHARAPDGATCGQHPAAQADFICARCGTFACAACRAQGFGQEGLCVRCQTSVGALASRGSRFAANFIDGLVVLLPVIGGVVAVGALGHSLDGAVRELAFIGVLGGIFVGGFVELVAQVGWGQSLGKRALGIQVVKLDGSPVELWRLIILRNVVSYGLGQLCGLYALIDALAIFGADQRCLHDHIAGTIVVEKPPDAPSP